MPSLPAPAVVHSPTISESAGALRDSDGTPPVPTPAGAGTVSVDGVPASRWWLLVGAGGGMKSEKGGRPWRSPEAGGREDAPTGRMLGGPRPCATTSRKASSRSSNADVALHRENRPGALTSSPLRSSYPASREDPETCPHTPSSYNSPHYSSNSSVLASASDLQASNTRHFNPMFQTSARSPWSTISNSGEGLERGPRRSSASTNENRSSVYWDPEAGRFVSSQSATGVSGHGGRTELLYTGQSIFFDGPILGDGAGRNLRNGGAPYQQHGGVVRGRGSDQHPVFVPSDSRK